LKTPREILLKRHQATAPKLDAIRREVLVELNHKDTKERSWTDNFVTLCLVGSKQLWLELIWPCRRIWTGLAAVWVFILAANISLREHSPAIIKSGPSSEMIMTLKDQQKILAELLTDHSLPHDADRQKIFSPKPRTEGMEILTV
jgi:hypothetical protein